MTDDLMTSLRLIRILQANPQLVGTCTECLDEFRFADALVFVADAPWPQAALDTLANKHADIRRRRVELKLQRRHFAVSVLPKMGEQALRKQWQQIMPSLPSFPFVPADCRAPGGAIDLIAFHGLSETGTVRALSFVALKAGSQRPTKIQRAVRCAVEGGRVRLVVRPAGKE